MKGVVFISTWKEKSWPLGTDVLKTSFVDLLILFPCQHYVSLCQLNEGNEVGMVHLDFIEVFDKIFYDLPLEEVKRHSQVNIKSPEDRLLENSSGGEGDGRGYPAYLSATPHF